MLIGVQGSPILPLVYVRAEIARFGSSPSLVHHSRSPSQLVIGPITSMKPQGKMYFWFLSERSIRSVHRIHHFRQAHTRDRFQSREELVRKRQGHPLLTFRSLPRQKEMVAGWMFSNSPLQHSVPQACACEPGAGSLGKDRIRNKMKGKENDFEQGKPSENSSRDGPYDSGTFEQHSGLEDV